eukprot:CAMPEP_0201475180 /NCGR_PEP_ID=MMETSP0151_2-20130828/628_1 /ASSEMBLY_ACC=CAM_ASM_000257 /TAXON_ID=200890 /ORGANISM="Paramoeba atlantica, Strain 621/1 / CCAP 1560/9" /LENGTH=96 /DNA_ID=CAMNT_0047855199 /DNA_START=310 /DNA_END=597 /DNA_ORIENTATION=-
MSRMGPVKLYVGGLAPDIPAESLARAFEPYGRVVSHWTARDPPGFGFVEMEYERDARDAIHGLDGGTIDGSMVRVEYARSAGGRGGGRRGDRYGGG